MTSTVSMLVYGSSGATIEGAPLIAGAGVGDGLLTTLPTLPTKSPNPATASERNGPTRPLPTHTIVAPRTMIANASNARSGVGSCCRRSIRLCRASRVGDGAMGRTLTGAWRPFEGGRGRTCGGRPPRRESIGADCRMKRPACPVPGTTGNGARPIRPGVIAVPGTSRVVHRRPGWCLRAPDPGGVGPPVLPRWYPALRRGTARPSGRRPCEGGFGTPRPTADAPIPG